MDALNVDLLSFFFTLFVAVISVVWTISNIKHTLDAKISSIKSEFKLSIHETNSSLELLRQEISHNHDSSDYLINDTRNLIDHRTNRLNSQINDINKYLAKNLNFNIRNSFNSSEE